MGRKASADIRQKIKEFEGLRLEPYKDAGGYSIGYGHYMGTTVPTPYQDGIEKDKAQSLFEADLTQAERAVHQEVDRELSQNEFDALVSFTFNLGRDNLRKVARKINEGAGTGTIQDKIKQYTKAEIDGQYQELPGLVERRNYEARLYGRSQGMATAEISALTLAALGLGFLLYKSAN